MPGIALKGKSMVKAIQFLEIVVPCHCTT
ncbi:hypothetical protein H635_YJM1083J00137 [Saccharomyces cerevisiae YJM1083]|nr:hypothetical protein H635_YJM1083J00137 [Saccharomyces cerevisiae YJM1083]